MQWGPRCYPLRTLHFPPHSSLNQSLARMQLIQAFLSLVPFFDNSQLDSKLSVSSHLATPPTHLNTCSGKLSSVPGYYNLSGGIDFSDPNVENILTGSGSSDPSGTSGSDGSGAFNPRRPVRGEGKQLRVNQRHHKHRTSAAVEPAQTCPDPAVLSCSTEAESGSVDSCCVVTPGGALVHVQLWDLDIGEADSCVFLLFALTLEDVQDSYV